MKWFTCILHIPDHVSPVQWFHTRAETAEQAGANAVRWFMDGEPSWERRDIGVPLVFDGKLEPYLDAEPDEETAPPAEREDQ